MIAQRCLLLLLLCLWPFFLTKIGGFFFLIVKLECKVNLNKQERERMAGQTLVVV
jgi:hypothetical protein